MVAVKSDYTPNERFLRQVIGPAKAADLLERSKGNRSIREQRVAAYARDMAAGEWHYNGVPIHILPDGTLFDGHHRLNAVIESDTKQEFDIHVLSWEAKDTIDQGASRTSADVLALDFGLAPGDARDVARAVRMIIAHDIGHDTWLRGGGGRTLRHFTHPQIRDWYSANQSELDDCVRWVHENLRHTHLLVAKGPVIAIRFLARRAFDPDRVDAYLTQVLTGYGVEPGSTEDHIRNTLLSVKMKQRKMSEAHRVATLCKGLRTVAAGRSIKHYSNAGFRPANDAIPYFPKGSP